MNRSFFSIATLALLASACGKHVLVGTTHSGERECIKGIQEATNCQVGTSRPTPTPVPTVGLVFTGDVPSPPPSGYTLVGSVRVYSGTSNTWQTLGQNNQPAVTTTIDTPLSLPGQCRNVNVNVQVTNAGPNSGVFYLSSDGSRFRVCEENGKILVEFEDAGDASFNDYKVQIASTNGQPLTYRWNNGWLQVCLD